MRTITTIAAILLTTLIGCDKMQQPPTKVPDNTPTNPADPTIIQRIHELHLQQRGENRTTLLINNQLNQAAQKHATWMARVNKMNHTGENGSSFWDRILASGYNPQTGSENIAYGYDTAESVIKGWMKSFGHRANILNTTWTEVGYGVAADNNGRKYWCTVFAKSSEGEIRIMSAPNDLVLPEPLSADDQPVTEE